MRLLFLKTTFHLPSYSGLFLVKREAINKKKQQQQNNNEKNVIIISSRKHSRKRARDKVNSMTTKDHTHNQSISTLDHTIGSVVCVIYASMKLIIIPVRLLLFAQQTDRAPPGNFYLFFPLPRIKLSIADPFSDNRYSSEIIRGKYVEKKTQKQQSFLIHTTFDWIRITSDREAISKTITTLTNINGKKDYQKCCAHCICVFWAMWLDNEHLFQMANHHRNTQIFIFVLRFFFCSLWMSSMSFDARCVCARHTRIQQKKIDNFCI